MKSGIIKEIDKLLVELATPELEELIDYIESERIARIESEEYEKKTEAGKMKINELEIGTKIYYRGDMANPEGFGEITELTQDKWGSFFSTKLDDGRKQKQVPLVMLDSVDTENCSTSFCTLEAYQTRRDKQIEAYNSYIKNISL